MASKNKPGCNCCSCEIVNDAFNRSDSSSLGSAWSEESGDWEIASNKLICDDDDALAATVSSAPSTTMHITCDVTAEASGVQSRVIACYEDANDYVFVRIIHGNPHVFALFHRVAGTSTQLGAAGTLTSIGGAGTDTVTVFLCHNGDVLTVNVENSSGTVRSLTRVATIPSSGTKAALGTGTVSGNEARFDNFVFSRHYAAGSASNCPECALECVPCADSIAPPAMLVYLEGLIDTARCNDCAQHDGSYVCPNTTLLATQCAWSTGSLGAWTCSPDSGDNFSVLVRVIENGASDYDLEVTVLMKTGQTQVFIKNYGSKPTCADFDEEEVPWDHESIVGSEICNADATTICLVTALV